MFVTYANIHIVGLFELKVEPDHWSCKV